MAGAIHKIIHCWHELPGQGAVLFRGDLDRNHYDAKFSISVFSTPAALKILCILVLRLHRTAARTSSSPHRRRSGSAFTSEKEPVSLEVLCTLSNVLQFRILRSGYCCWYSTTAAIPFPLNHLPNACQCILYLKTF